MDTCLSYEKICLIVATLEYDFRHETRFNERLSLFCMICYYFELMSI